ncbi:Uncharacterised protein [Dermatophilus congolensis]|uniref:Uncharacterized protein n=1 Tax=Dermatophilus congolensis TaxID=1863 RepID=A0AA46BLL5_9MICO|nr:Uncharacterised protein [Dermatophilus congolensis]
MFGDVGDASCGRDVADGGSPGEGVEDGALVGGECVEVVSDFVGLGGVFVCWCESGDVGP